MREFNAGIIGTGHALPSGVISNSDLERMVETSDEWITTRTGICERRKAGPDEYTSMFAVVSRVEKPRGILSSRIQSDGTLAEYLYTPGGGTRFPATHDSIDNRLHFIKMRGNELFKVAVRSMTDISMKVLDEVKMTAGDI